MKKVSENDPSSLVPAKRQKCATSAKLITDLPYDVMEKILELAVGTKKSAGFLNASRVCRQWHRIISESPRIMNVLSPTVTMKRSADVDGNVLKFSITRKYREFTLCDDSDPKDGTYTKHPTVIMSTISACLTDSLRSLSLCNLKLDPSYFGAMSLLKLLKNLTILSCTAEPVNVNPISFELNCLKIEDFPQCILDWMNCKKLKIFDFNAEHRPDASTINFLNRLEQLDELKFESFAWKSNVPELKPKFMWMKLKLQIPWNPHELSNVAKSNIIALGRASAADGEAHITFYSDGLNDSQRADFTINFLNNCKKIKTLEFDCDESIRADLSTLRVMDEVETLYKLDCNFKDAEGLIGLKSLLDKMPNIKNLTLKLCSYGLNDEDDGEPDELDDDVIMNDPISIQLKNLEILTIRPPMCYKTLNTIGFDSTSMFWKIFSFGSSLKQLQISPRNMDNWHSTNDDGELDEEFSPIRLYKDWVSAENRSSVESCTMKLRRDPSVPSHGMEKTRDEVELEVFGRLLLADEKKFFSEIIIKD